MGRKRATALIEGSIGKSTSERIAVWREINSLGKTKEVDPQTTKEELEEINKAVEETQRFFKELRESVKKDFDDALRMANDKGLKTMEEMEKTANDLNDLMLEDDDEEKNWKVTLQKMKSDIALQSLREEMKTGDDKRQRNAIDSARASGEEELANRALAFGLAKEFYERDLKKRVVKVGAVLMNYHTQNYSCDKDQKPWKNTPAFIRPKEKEKQKQVVYNKDPNEEHKRDI